jgi:hypothetical protein
MATSEKEKALQQWACDAVVARLQSGQGTNLVGAISTVFEETRADAWRAATLAALANGASLEGMYAAGVVAGVWRDLPLVPERGVDEWASAQVEHAFASCEAMPAARLTYPRDPWLVGSIGFMRRDGRRRDVTIAAEVGAVNPNPGNAPLARDVAFCVVLAAVLREISGPPDGPDWDVWYR